LEIFSQVRSRYAEDPTIMSIVRAGEEICSYSMGTLEGSQTEEPINEESVMEEGDSETPAVEEPEE